MHAWGDEDVDWNGINDAARYIYNYLKWWRVPVRDCKEKFGTVRVYTGLSWERGWLLQHLFYPNYVYYQFPKWVRKLDYMFPTHWLNIVIVPFYKWLYKRAYGNALKKWPHLRMEILSAADYHELLKDHGIHTVRTSENGYAIHYDWHKDNYVYPEVEEYPLFEMSMDQLWDYLNKESPATSIVLNQDYEGIITAKVKYPTRDVMVSKGHTVPRAALLELAEIIEDEKEVEDEKSATTNAE